MVAKPQETATKQSTLSSLLPLNPASSPPPPPPLPSSHNRTGQWQPPEGRETCFKYQLVIFGLALSDQG